MISIWVTFCDHQTGWLQEMSGQARFEVTLIPDEEDPPHPPLDLAVLEALFQRMNQTLVLPRNVPTQEANPMENDSSHDNGSGPSSSRFADAET